MGAGLMQVSAWNRGQWIKVQTGGGPRHIQADLVGPFAIHKGIADSGHAVTHLASGLQVAAPLTYQGALKMANRLWDLAIDWKRADLQAVLTEDNRKAIQDVLQGVAVEEQETLAAAEQAQP